MPIFGTPNQGGKHDRRRFNNPGGTPFCFGSYWANLFSGFNRVLLSDVIGEGNDVLAGAYCTSGAKLVCSLAIRAADGWSIRAV